MKEQRDKERRDIPKPDPLLVGGMRIEVVIWGKVRGLGQNGGYIAAINPRTGQELWLLKVYDVDYSSGIESDKADRFIQAMRIVADDTIEVVAERGEVYRVNVSRQTSSRRFNA